MTETASAMRPEAYGEGYWERGEGSNYVAYGDDPGWRQTLAVLRRFAPPPDKMLEVACAKGFFVRAAAETGYDAEGVDLSHWAVDHCPASVRSRIRQGNAVDLPWFGERFGMVCSWEFLEHVPEGEIDRVLTEMLRVARPGALMVHRIGTLEAEADRSQHLHDHTHVTNQPRTWWSARLREYALTPRPDVEAALDAMFSGRDWSGRFFAYDVG